MGLNLNFKYSFQAYKFKRVLDESVSVFVRLATYDFMGELFVSRGIIFFVLTARDCH